MSPNGGLGGHCQCEGPSERRRKRDARVLIYVRGAMGVQADTEDNELLSRQARGYVYEPERDTELSELVCAMTDEERERIVYDAHNRDSRRAADWWEEWQVAEAKRRRRKAPKRRKEKLREQAKAKLTRAELAALKEER